MMITQKANNECPPLTSALWKREGMPVTQGAV